MAKINRDGHLKVDGRTKDCIQSRDNFRCGTDCACMWMHWQRRGSPRLHRHGMG